MGYEIKKVDVWSVELPDRPGGLSSALASLVEAGANLNFLLARRTTKGKGIAFISPLEGTMVIKTAKLAGFSKNKDLSALQITGPDKPGIGLSILNVLGSANINIRGISASAIGKDCVLWIAFDSAKDSSKALKLLRKLLVK